MQGTTSPEGLGEKMLTQVILEMSGVCEAQIKGAARKHCPGLMAVSHGGAGINSDGAGCVRQNGTVQ